MMRKSVNLYINRILKVNVSKPFFFRFSSVKGSDQWQRSDKVRSSKNYLKIGLKSQDVPIRMNIISKKMWHNYRNFTTKNFFNHKTLAQDNHFF